MFFPRVCRRWCWQWPHFSRWEERGLVLVMKLVDMFRHFPYFSDCRGYAMDHFFPAFFFSGVTCLLRIERCDRVLKIWCSSVQSSWISAVLYPGKRIPIASTSSVKQQVLLQHFSSPGLSINLSVPEYIKRRIWIPIRFFVKVTHGRMPIITRRVRALSCKEFVARFLAFPFRRTAPSGATSFRRSPSVIFFTSISEWERTTVFSFHAHRLHDGNYKNLLLNTVLLFSTDNILSRSGSWPTQHFNLFSQSFSRRLIAQEETNNRHQCKSDKQAKKRKHQHSIRCFLPTSSPLKKGDSSQPWPTLIQKLVHALLSTFWNIYTKQRSTQSSSNKPTAQVNKLFLRTTFLLARNS